MRPLSRTTIVFLLYAVLPLTTLAQTTSTPLVLGYHRVVEKDAEITQTSDVTTTQLENHIQHLLHLGYAPIRSEEIDSKKNQVKRFVVTIDDGNESDLKVAAPILKRLRIPATFFVITGWVGKAGRLDWQQVLELEKDELFSVESHSETHPYLRAVPGNHRQVQSLAELRQELRGSREALQSKLQRPVLLLAYPYGVYNSQVIRETRAAGFSRAFAIDSAPSVPSTSTREFETRRLLLRQANREPHVFPVALREFLLKK